jgi:protein-L-isoaspartate(D-aspartate) O-methyltransferase
MATQIHSDGYAAERQIMVASQLRGRGIRDQRVLDAMARVPRHEFVAEEYREQAYEDHPIPIGEGQTVSQPYIVALTLDALSLQPSFKVLEIGTGSGYQTALLAELCSHVYSVERHAPLARDAEAALARLGYNNVSVIVGDGSHGLPDMAPFDAIVVSAAAPQIPTSLFAQLREGGGRMVIPVGPPQAQELQLVSKQDGRPMVQSLDGCRFVPLIGGQGYSSSSW